MGTPEEKLAARLEAIEQLRKDSKNTENDSNDSTNEEEVEELEESSENENEEEEVEVEELGSGGLSALKKLREENKTLRREGSESSKKYEDLISLLSRHLGLDEEVEVEDSLAKAQNRAVQLEREKSVILNPGVGNAERLLRDKYFLEELYALESDDVKSIKSLIKEFCEENPHLKASAARSVDVAGGQSRKKASAKTPAEKAREARLRAYGKN